MFSKVHPELDPLGSDFRKFLPIVARLTGPDVWATDPRPVGSSVGGALAVP
jgi:hypothetical protein